MFLFWVNGIFAKKHAWFDELFKLLMQSYKSNCRCVAGVHSHQNHVNLVTDDINYRFLKVKNSEFFVLIEGSQNFTQQYTVVCFTSTSQFKDETDNRQQKNQNQLGAEQVFE